MNHINVISSNIKTIGYDAESKTLEVFFLSGSKYRYNGISEKIYTAFLNAKSKGKFFAEYILKYYKGNKINELTK